jgi:hypothetical protein
VSQVGFAVVNTRIGENDAAGVSDIQMPNGCERHKRSQNDPDSAQVDIDRSGYHYHLGTIGVILAPFVSLTSIRHLDIGNTDSRPRDELGISGGQA